MKPRTFFGLALLFPYALWCICALILALLSLLENSDALNMILLPIMFYTLGVIFWLAPYTILAIGMWVWGRNKSTRALNKLALVAPILLFGLMLIEVLLISLPAPSVNEIAKDFLKQGMLFGACSLIFGYLCVGIVLGIYKFLKAKQFITEETSPLLLDGQPITNQA